MAFSPQIDDHDVAGFVPRPKIVRPALKFSVASMHEALAPEIGFSELNPEFPDTCFVHVNSEHSRRVDIVAALVIEQVAT